MELVLDADEEHGVVGASQCHAATVCATSLAVGAHAATLQGRLEPSRALGHAFAGFMVGVRAQSAARPLLHAPPL